MIHCKTAQSIQVEKNIKGLWLEGKQGTKALVSTSVMYK